MMEQLSSWMDNCLKVTDLHCQTKKTSQISTLNCSKSHQYALECWHLHRAQMRDNQNHDGGKRRLLASGRQELVDSARVSLG